MENVFLKENKNNFLAKTSFTIYGLLPWQAFSFNSEVTSCLTFLGVEGQENTYTGAEVNSVISYVLILKNSFEDPNTIVKISNNSTEWEDVVGWSHFSENPAILESSTFIQLQQAGILTSENYDKFYITNINFHDWSEAYISIEYAKTSENPLGISEKLKVTPTVDLTWFKNEILTKENLNYLENLIQINSLNTYNPSVWKDNDIVTLEKLNNLEDSASKYGINYVKQSWKENDEITSDKLNHITNFYSRVGEVQFKDGIESICIYSSSTPQSWGQHIFVDKNHDLCYYILGNDFVNDTDYTSNKWGPEWGGYGIETGITTQSVGTGLTNTNSLIDLNLQPRSEDWPVIWSWVQQFRNNHSNNWFVPTSYEIIQMSIHHKFLSNFSCEGTSETNPFYWASTEGSSNIAYMCTMVNNMSVAAYSKDYHQFRVRLCYYE